MIFGIFDQPNCGTQINYHHSLVHFEVGNMVNKIKSRLGCGRWAPQPHLTPPCTDFTCRGLKDIWGNTEETHGGGQEMHKDGGRRNAHGGGMENVQFGCTHRYKAFESCLQIKQHQYFS